VNPEEEKPERPTLVREREIIDLQQASIPPSSNVADQANVIHEEQNESEDEESSGPD
jgi:hypothetical protein